MPSRITSSATGDRHRSFVGASVAILVAALLFTLLGSGQTGSPEAAARAATASGGAVDVPLLFEANEGQADDEVEFVTRAPGYTVALSPTEIAFTLSTPAAGAGGAEGDDALELDERGESRHVVGMGLVGADSDPSVEGLDRAPGRSNYLRGSDPDEWITDVAQYERVVYRDVYSGVDLLFHESDGELKYDFEVEPGADPDVIGLEFTDGEPTVDDGGDLVVSTDAGELRHEAPLVYHEDEDGAREEVEARYTIDDDVVSFEIDDRDPDRRLVIDPVLTYATYIGGLGNDEGLGITGGADGSTYLAGRTFAANFPTTDGAFQEGDAGGWETFVSKLNADGDLEYSTYLGGDATDWATALALDEDGMAVVAGRTDSDDFPTTAAAAQEDRADDNDAFVAKLSADGASLVYSTYLGGTGADIASGLSLDDDGTAVVSGPTNSDDFPATAGAAQENLAQSGTNDVFVTKVAPNGESFEQSTYLGGTGSDAANGVALDADGAVYVSGQTGSDDFPTTAGAYQESHAGGDDDAFVAKLATDLTDVDYATYLGGTDGDAANDVGVDSNGRAYVVGRTTSADFPLASALQETFGGGDAFAARLAADGAALDYSTYLGGSGSDWGIALDVVDDHVYFTGFTGSATFPTLDPLASYAGHNDAFITELDGDGELAFSTYLGGIGDERARAISVDQAGGIHLTGVSQFADDFPLVDPIQDERGGGNGDAFVARIAPEDPDAPLVTGLDPSGGPTSGGAIVEIEGRRFDGATEVAFGGESAADFTVESDTQITATTPPGDNGPAVVTVTTPQGTSPANPVAEYMYGAGQWSLTGALEQARNDHTSTLMGDGRVLVTGGRDVSTNEALATAEVYDPQTGEWTTTEPMNQERFSHAATTLADGRVLVTGGFVTGGGTNAQAVTDSAEIYDPETDTWSGTDSLNVRRALHAEEFLDPDDGRVLVTGGRSCDEPPPEMCNFQVHTSTAEVYDPGDGTWTEVDPMEESRYNTNATQLDDGRVVVAGGFPQPPKTSVEAFDPDDGSWETLASLDGPRGRVTSMLLDDGDLLVPGGWSGPTGPVESVERYDPDGDEWSLTDSLINGRWNFQSAMLSTGEALVAGGGVGGITSEVYDPDTESWRPASRLHFARGSTSSLADNIEAVLLSSDPHEFAADPDVCGDLCGKVLVVGDSSSPVAELYTPTPMVDGASPDSGPVTGGTEVTITGVGLYGASEVWFGDTPAQEVTADSDSEITAVAPEGEEGTVDITVTTDGGRSEPVDGATFTFEAVDPPGLTRLSGADRVLTAIAVSQEAFEDGAASGVVLARSTDFADALSGAPLAAMQDAPTLLTPPGELDGRTAAELQRVASTDETVWLLGGAAALSASVADEVEALGYSTQRLGGATRVETSLEIAEALGGPDELLVTTGEDFPDAVTAGAAAAHTSGAVLLTSSEEPHPAVTEYLDGRDGASVSAVGGPAARAHPEATAVFGATREATAVAVAETFFTAPEVVGLARRDDFPDALTGGAHVGSLGGPMLLTPTDALHGEPSGFLCATADTLAGGFIYGGTQAVTDSTMATAAARLVGDGC